MTDLLYIISLILFGGGVLIIFILPPEKMKTKKGIAVGVTAVFYATIAMTATLIIWGNIGIMTYAGLIAIPVIVGFVYNLTAVVRNSF